jgi:hypothetical protein
MVTAERHRLVAVLHRAMRAKALDWSQAKCPPRAISPANLNLVMSDNGWLKREGCDRERNIVRREV